MSTHSLVKEKSWNSIKYRVCKEELFHSGSGLSKVYMAEVVRRKKRSFGLLWKTVDQHTGERVWAQCVGVKFTVCGLRSKEITQLIEEKLQRIQGYANLPDFKQMKVKWPFVWLFAEFVEGESLEEYMLKDSLNVEKLMDVMCGTANAVRCLHSNDIVHGDVQPAKIIVQDIDDGRLHVKLIDYALPTIVQVGSWSQFQILGEKSHDIISLGEIFYNILLSLPSSLPELSPDDPTSKVTQQIKQLTKDMTDTHSRQQLSATAVHQRLLQIRSITHSNSGFFV